MATKRVSGGKVPNLRFSGFEGEWVTAKLEDVTEKTNSGKTPLGGESTYLAEGIVFIRSQNVNKNQLDLSSPIFISKEVNNGMKNSVVKPNDILLNITGASLGRSCVVPNDFKVGNVNQHVCIIRSKKTCDPRFIQPILSSAKGQAIFESLQTGSGREGLNFESIKKIELDFPDLVEQQKIAGFLSLIDQRIETQNLQIGDMYTERKLSGNNVRSLIVSHVPVEIACSAKAICARHSTFCRLAKNRLAPTRGQGPQDKIDNIRRGD